MVGFNPKKITGKYCPECESPMVIYGAGKYKMVMCLNNECRNYITLEKALGLDETQKGKEIYKTGYHTGYEDGHDIGSIQGKEFLDD